MCSTWDGATQRETDLKAFCVKLRQLSHKEDDARQNFYKGENLHFFAINSNKSANEGHKMCRQLNIFIEC